MFGFTSMLFTLLERDKPDAIVVALDAPGKTFRHAEYEAYKGTRKETQDELKVQLIEARHFIDALGIPSIELTGYEADDIVGTISRLGEENGYFTTIVTGDLDSLQLVDDYVCVLTMTKGVSDTSTYGPKEVVERYGFGPEHVPDFKALKGDTSDNIPGVPGIGDKGAAELIQAFGTIESMIEKFDDVPAKYQKKIEGNQEQMRKSKWLATIDRHVPIQYDFKPFSLNETQMADAIAMLERFEFKTHARRAVTVLGRYKQQVESEGGTGEVLQPALVIEESIEVEYSKCVSFEELVSFVGANPFAVYFPSLSARTDLFPEERPAYIAVGKTVKCFDEDGALELVAKLSDQAILHDSKPVYKRLLQSRDDLVAPYFDSMLAGYVLRSDRSAYALRDLLQGYLDLNPPTEPQQMAGALALLAPAMQDRLEKEGQASVLTTMELPLVPILAKMEKLGVCADRTQLREFSKELEVAIQRTAAAIFELAGEEFTIGSPKQLGEILFGKMGIPGAQKTKTGYATGAEILSELAAEHPIASEVMNWRELSKLKSTYADSLEKLIQPDGRIHTTYNQAVAATGRLSSNDPNLQNIPIRTELGRGIRKAFHAAEGYRFASLDYSQIELRVLAHMCGEKALVDAFNHHEDVHTVTAQTMFGLGQGAATKEQRRLAKMLNYAVLYGVSEYGLAQQLGAGFSISEAKQLITQYNERFPSVKGFTASVVQDAKSKGFTTTLRGRRRYFPDIHAAKMMERKYAERQAMNAPIQGTAADMLKLAMIDAEKRLQGSGVRMLLNVHDELVFEVPVGHESMIEPLRGVMENALPLSVPVEVDAKVGAEWNEMTPVER